MLILVTKDGATVVPKEVAGLEEAQAFAEQGFVVHVETEAGRVPLADLLQPPADPPLSLPRPEGLDANATGEDLRAAYEGETTSEAGQDATAAG